MNLKITLSKELLNKLNITTFNFAVPFDLYNHKYVDGYLVADDKKIYVIVNNKLMATHNIFDYEHIYVESTSRGGYLYGKKGDAEFFIVEFSKHCHEKVSSVALGLELYIQEGFIAINDMPEKHCPHCGTPYVEGSKFCVYCGKSKGVFKTFLPYLFKYKWLLFAYLGVMVLSILADLVRPIIYQVMVDDYLLSKEAFSTIKTGFITVILLLIVIHLFKSVTQMIRGIIEPTISFGMIHDLRVKVYDKVQHLSLSSANKKTTGGLITRISDDISTISNVLSNNFVYLIYNSVEIIVLLFIMFFQDWVLTLLVIIPIPIVVILTNKLWRLIGSKYQKRWKYLSNTNTVLHDILSGIKVVKTYGMEEKEIERFKDANKKLKNIDIYTETFWSIFTPIINFLFGLSQIIIYMYIGFKIVGDGQTMSWGDLIKWGSFAGMLLGCASQLANFPRRYNEMAISAEKVSDILLEETTEETGEKVNQDIKGEVCFNDVRFGYISFTPVLKNITFKINPGETIGIVGYSGSGKTTLVNLLMKLYEPSNGSIIVDGMDISVVDSFEYRKKLGVVLQETLLFSGTIMENILYGNDKASKEDVIKVCKMAKAHDFIMKKEFGYDTKLGKQGEGLSGGERQRIAIARALLSNPSIFIFDEATSSLDTVTEKEIQDAIAEVSSGKTTFIIAHRLSTLKNANKLIVLKHGKMVEFGSHEELIAKKGYYYSLVEAQYMNYEKSTD